MLLTMLCGIQEWRGEEEEGGMAYEDAHPSVHTFPKSCSATSLLFYCGTNTHFTIIENVYIHFKSPFCILNLMKGAELQI